MLKIGSHVSFKKDTQLLGSLNEALSYGSSTFMFYTGAPQNTNRALINDDITSCAIKKMRENNIDINDVIVHAPYIINLANSDSEKYKFSIRFLKEECKRCEQLHISKLVLHPGSHVGLGEEVGLDNIIAALNEILPTTSVTILLETMAGKGTELGRDLSQMKKIIDGVKYPNIGICLDTCHLSDAGYDMASFDLFLDKLDGLDLFDRVGCIHINDSKNPLCSHKDRHENIGFGYLGFDVLLNIVHNDRLKDISKILETPYIGEVAPYGYEIAMFRNKKFDDEFKKIKNV